MTRFALSRPIATAAADQLLDPSKSIFDYGCGRGDDLRHLAALGYTVDGWDPTHRPQAERREADVVNLGYVVNVIERPDERAETLRSAWALARELLIVSSRLTWDARNLVGRPVGDGLMTRTGTFQKFYEQSELAGWIEANTRSPAACSRARDLLRLPRPCRRAAVSRHAGLHVSTAGPDRPARLYTTPIRTVLAPLFDFLRDHARPPRSGELDDQQVELIKDALGSLGRASNLIRQVTDDSHWERVAIHRRAELLIYVALSRFGRRPRFSQLGRTLAADIRTLFGTYQAACVQADRVLLACGDPAMVLVTARSSPVGKQTPTSLYVHRSALGELPPLLQVYEGCARVLSGTVEHANMIKLKVTQPQVSYLSYPRFDRDPHPTLSASVTVNLKKLTVDWRDYSRSDNPPLLHRKEEFLGQR